MLPVDSIAILAGVALPVDSIAILAGLALLAILFVCWLCLRYIPHNQVGIVEKLWSAAGSVQEGQIVASHGKAGYQVDILRGGYHVGYWRWQYRIHRVPLVTIPEGKIGYVYARDGEPLPPSQTLGRIVPCNHFQDARAFLGQNDEEKTPVGQRGRQRAILREGVYAINLALFAVITEDHVYGLPGSDEWQTLTKWVDELQEVDGFTPVIVGKPVQTVDPVQPEKSIVVQQFPV